MQDTYTHDTYKQMYVEIFNEVISSPKVLR